KTPKLASKKTRRAPKRENADTTKNNKQKPPNTLLSSQTTEPDLRQPNQPILALDGSQALASDSFRIPGRCLLK
ncbi:hypothetical protein, partial [Mycobacterium sp. 236(2023)]|uniref:hypothetical protein n=1 Tax=Mycobacterium sp. 236(2023) TaxID=3038163 RepID=UPI002415924A